MNIKNAKNSIIATLKLQPVVLLYSLVSVGSKLASNQIPSWEGNLVSYFLKCVTNWKLLLILFAMFLILFIYAIIWQKCIKNVPISVMYANKSAYIFWTQLAAIFIFSEKLNWSNIIGIIIIFTGIMVVNGDE